MDTIFPSGLTTRIVTDCEYSARVLIDPEIVIVSPLPYDGKSEPTVSGRTGSS